MSETRSGVAVVTHESGWVSVAVVYRVVNATIYSFVIGRSTCFKEARVDGSYDVTHPSRPTGVHEYGKVETPSLEDRIPHAVWRGSLVRWSYFYRLGNRVFDDDEERSSSFSDMMKWTPDESQLLLALPYQFQGLLDYRKDGSWLMSPSFPSNPGVFASGAFLQYFSPHADQRVLRLCTLYSEVDYHWD